MGDTRAREPYLSICLIVTVNMRKIIITAALALATMGLAAPANADNVSNIAGGVTTANNWQFSPGSSCISNPITVPVVPVLDIFAAFPNKC